MASELDTVHAAPTSRRFAGFAGGLQVVQENLGLQDVWRTLNPNRTAFTHQAAHGGGRLDRWLASQELMPLCHMTNIHDDLPGDHLGVSVKIIARTGVLQGPPTWRFPVHLLDDADFRKRTQDLLEDFFGPRAVHDGLSHADRWDAFKVGIRDFTQAFSWREAAAKQSSMSALRAAAAVSREQYTLDPSNTQALQAWQLARLDLQTWHSAIAAEAALRAGILWGHYGEQSTFYFHHLARQRQAKTSIASLQDPITGATHTLDTFMALWPQAPSCPTSFHLTPPLAFFARLQPTPKHRTR